MKAPCDVISRLKVVITIFVMRMKGHVLQSEFADFIFKKKNNEKEIRLILTEMAAAIKTRSRLSLMHFTTSCIRRKTLTISITK
jgi:hypothetical protein